MSSSALSNSASPKMEKKSENGGRKKISHMVAKRLLCHALKGIQSGHLIIVEGQQSWEFGHAADVADLSARIVVENGDLWTAVLTRGSIGAGEAWMAGLWTSPDLTAVIRIFVRNRNVLNILDGSSSFFSRLAMRTVHHLNKNTVEGSQRNISAHYDLSNDFFESFLDKTMMYSSAVFESSSQDLYSASLNKLNIVCRQLKLKGSDKLVEIGSGWGGLAIYAAKNYGCHVTTVTISQEQYQYAKNKIEASGLSDRITILLKDYREMIDSDTIGRFDKLVSIEMIEAVGAEFQADYFRICSSLLKPGGLALIQAITIAEDYYDAYLNDTDFIRHYIFPGGCLPTLERMDRLTREQSDLRLLNSRDITLDYAYTLKAWRNGFFKHKSRITAMGFDERFFRMWEFYFCYCEGGFMERSTGTHQVLFNKL
jgi:cyclopropane-fatty-acyl-phospholipid synthase